LRRCVGGVHQFAGFGDLAHQTFAQTHAGLVHRFAVQTFGRAKFKRVFVAEQIDGTHLCSHRIRNQMGDFIKPLLSLGLFGHGIAQAA